MCRPVKKGHHFAPWSIGKRLDRAACRSNAVLLLTGPHTPRPAGKLRKFDYIAQDLRLSLSGLIAVYVKVAFNVDARLRGGDEGLTFIPVGEPQTHDRSE
jgi:hypothetical protein